MGRLVDVGGDALPAVHTVERSPRRGWGARDGGVISPDSSRFLSDGTRTFKLTPTVHTERHLNAPRERAGNFGHKGWRGSRTTGLAYWRPNAERGYPVVSFQPRDGPRFVTKPPEMAPTPVSTPLDSGTRSFLSHSKGGHLNERCPSGGRGEGRDSDRSVTGGPVTWRHGLNMAALRYEGIVWIFVNDDLLGEGTALLARRPNREADSSWSGDIVVRGVDGVKLLGVNRIRVPSGEERHVRVKALNVADAEDAIAQAMSFDGFGSPPF